MLLKITEKCSLGCSHCMNSATPDGKHMTEEIFEDAVRFLIRNDACKSIILTGGEPAEHPDFEHIMSLLISRLEMEKKTSVITITTNGFWCLDNPVIAADMTKSSKYTQVFWQVSTDSRFYPKSIPKHKRLWRESGFVFCDDCVQHVYPQGRALTNNLPWEAKASKCFNVRAMAKQLDKPTFGTVIQHLGAAGFHCTPAIRVDGTIGLGESDLCPAAASIYDSDSEIIKKIIDFECHQCDFINNRLDPIYKQFV